MIRWNVTRRKCLMEEAAIYLAFNSKQARKQATRPDGPFAGMNWRRDLKAKVVKDGRRKNNHRQRRRSYAYPV